MAVKVEQVTKTKSGRGLRVLLSGTWYNAFIDSGLEGQVGNFIEAEIRTHDKYGAGVHTWKPVVQSNAAPQGAQPSAQPSSPSPAVAAPIQPSQAAPYKYAEPSDNVAPWYMAFVSNTVAHAIEKGLCASPEAINQWALKAAQVAVAIKEEVK